MKRSLFLGSAFLALFALQSTASVAEDAKESVRGPRIERYRYEAISTGHQDSEKDSIAMEFIEGEEGIEYHSEVISSDSLEEISIRMDKEARFLSGVRSVYPSPDKPARQERIWRDEHKAVVERLTEGGIKRKEHRLPADKELAVDGSLLALLRFFPFDAGKEWDLFMVDFSGYSISVTVKWTGMETILVPAGEFECYRVEVAVNIPILRPKILYWLSKMKPHFLVKHQGKRGPFTPTYLTSLLSFD